MFGYNLPPPPGLVIGGNFQFKNIFHSDHSFFPLFIILQNECFLKQMRIRMCSEGHKLQSWHSGNGKCNVFDVFVLSSLWKGIPQ
jgi:hypothetical protein